MNKFILIETDDIKFYLSTEEFELFLGDRLNALSIKKIESFTNPIVKSGFFGIVRLDCTVKRIKNNVFIENYPYYWNIKKSDIFILGRNKKINDILWEK